MGKQVILCEPQQISHFVKAIQSLLNNEELRLEMAHQARSYALTQTWEIIFDTLLAHYEYVLHERNILYA